MTTKSNISVIDLTCAHCGRQRHFNSDGIDAFQLMYVDAQLCNYCGKLGATVIMTSYENPLQFDLEDLPASIRSPVKSRSSSPAR